MSEVHDECGVAAIYHLPGRGVSPLCTDCGPDAVSRLMPRMLLDIQNRGQLAAGMSTYHPHRKQLIGTYKDVGTVAEVFRMNHRTQYEGIMKEIDGRAAIGHVRYATCGGDDKNYAQPFERPHIKKHKWFSFAFNGQLANYSKLRCELLDDDNNHLARETDTEVFMHQICTSLTPDRQPPLIEVMREIGAKFDGAYSMVFLDALGDMIIARDPLGIKPLVYAVEGPLVAAASESVALMNLGFAPESIKPVQPGQAIVISNGRLEIQSFHLSPRRAHCFFEWVYFANVASTLDNRSVYLTRKALGEELARLETVPIDDETVVVPVPDTSKAAADAMAYALKIPSVEGLIRNRYAGRTFIEGSGDRKRKAETKYTPLREVLEGKRVILVEDSIVRDDAQSPPAAYPPDGPAAGDPCTRGLPADHCAVLLRHRHVNIRRVVRAAVSAKRSFDAGGGGPHGRAAGGRFAPLFAGGGRGPRDRFRGKRPVPGLHHGPLSDAQRPGPRQDRLGQ